ITRDDVAGEFYVTGAEGSDTLTGINNIAFSDITLSNLNFAPVFSAPALADGVEDGAYVITEAELLNGATDADGDSLSVTGLVATNAVITDNGNGSWTITPDQDFNGRISLNYNVTDGNLSTGGSATIDVTAVNDAAVSGVPSLSVATEDTAFIVTAGDLLASATDADGDALTISDFSVDNGLVTDLGNGSWQITPDQHFNGLMVLSYKLNDGTTDTDATASLSWDPVNDAPVLGTPVLSAATEDNGYLLDGAVLLATASDAEGDSLQITGLTIDHGTLADNGDGTWTVTPEANFAGAATVSYSISDGSAETAGTVTLTYSPLDDIPT
ncbi:unnamed protein product, partial [Ectocarpus sp. 8 AP-2014]